MQYETDHTKHQAWKGFLYPLCLFLFFFLLAGCQHLAHEPEVSSEQTPNNEFGLLRDDVVSPEMPSDPVAQTPEISVEEALPTEKADDETLDKHLPDTPEDEDIVESNIVEEKILDKTLSIAALQQLQPQDGQTPYLPASSGGRVSAGRNGRADTGAGNRSIAAFPKDDPDDP